MGKRTAMYPKGFVTGIMSDSNYTAGAMTYLNSDGTVAGALSKEETQRVLYPYLESAVRRDQNIYIGAFARSHFGPYGVKDVDPPLPIPTRFYSYKRPKRSNQPQWARSKRKNSSSIVVSNYLNWQVELNYTYGLVNGRKRSTSTGTINCRESGLFPSVGPNRLQIGGYLVPNNGPNILKNFVGMEYDFGPSPFELGWSDNIALRIVESFNFKVNGSLVTDAAAAANTGTLDLLTTLAEAPETIKSALRGCTTIMRMYRDAKTKNLRLLNKASLKRLEKNKWLQLTRDEKRDAKAHALHMQKLRSYEQAIKDLASAAADVWLNYRLNILPTVGAVEDALKGIDDLSMEVFFRRYRETTEGALSTDIELSGWELSPDSFRSLERVMIKRAVGSEQSFRQIFSMNPFLTAWELVPLSFVVDRYMNIGALLAGFYGPSTNVKEGSTYSWKVDDTIVFTHKLTKASVSMRFSCYKRLVINPSTYLCIPFPPNRSRDQSLDHLALAWKLVINNLWKV